MEVGGGGWGGGVYQVFGLDNYADIIKKKFHNKKITDTSKFGRGLKQFPLTGKTISIDKEWQNGYCLIKIKKYPRVCVSFLTVYN